MYYRMRTKALLFVICFFSIVPSYVAAQLNIWVGIAPFAGLVERIAEAKVNVLLPAGKNPEFFSLSNAKLTRVIASDIVFLSSFRFERKIEALLRRSKVNVIHLDRGFRYRKIMHIVKDSTRSHRTEQQKRPRHTKRTETLEENDPHVWTDIEQIDQIILNIQNALIQLDPARKQDYQRRTRLILLNVQRTRKSLSKILLPYQGKVFYINHPALGYFSDCFHLRQRPLEIEGKETTPYALLALVDEARLTGVRGILVQKQFSKRNATQFAKQLHIDVVEVNLLQRDWFTMMDEVLDALQKVFP